MKARDGRERRRSITMVIFTRSPVQFYSTDRTVTHEILTCLSSDLLCLFFSFRRDVLHVRTNVTVPSSVSIVMVLIDECKGVTQATVEQTLQFWTVCRIWFWMSFVFGAYTVVAVRHTCRHITMYVWKYVWEPIGRYLPTESHKCFPPTRSSRRTRERMSAPFTPGNNLGVDTTASVYSHCLFLFIHSF